MVLPIIIGLVLIIFIFLFGLTIRSAFIGAPYFKTPKKAIREIFALAEIQPGQKLYDLGAGDGQALIIGQKEFGVQAFGFELSPIVWVVARLNLLLQGARAKIYIKNFYNQDLSGADVIFCFLSIHAMARLKPKFEQELRLGTKVISYSFAIHGWTPKEVIRKYHGNVYLYEV